MNLRASTLFLLLFGCGGAVVTEPSEPEVNIPTNVPKSSSGGASAGSKSSDFSSAPPASSCNAGVVDGYGCEGGRSITSAADLLEAIESLTAQRVSIAKGTALLVSSDFRAESDVELSASDLAATKDCDGCQTPYFRARAFPRFDAVPGVRCIEQAPSQPVVRVQPACARVAIAKGTMFRLRSVVQDMHPSAPTYWSFVDFLTACTLGCNPGEIYSSQSHQCFTSAYEACAYGEGLSPEYCSCRADECHQKPKGAACSFASSPDVEEVGTCGQSGCVPKG